MFPLKDSVPARTPPVMNWVLIGLNALVFWLELSLSAEELERLFTELGIVPARFAAGFGPHETLTLVTSMFLHGGTYHVFSNMWMLWIFGDNVEDRMGPWRFLVFYLACGIAAGLVHTFFNPGSVVPTVGASGAIAGVMGGYVLLYPRARVLAFVPLLFLPLFFEVTALFFIGLWFVGQVVSATWTLIAPQHVGGIAWWAHIGGFAGGLLLVYPLCSKRCHPRRLQRDEWSAQDIWRRMR